MVESCPLDEMPTANAYLKIKFIPVPLATEPYVDCTPEVRSLVDRLDVDTETMRTYLQHSVGWSAVHASAIHVEFLAPKQFQEKFGVPALVAGVHQSKGLRTGPTGHSDETDLVSFRHIIAFPLTERLLTTGGVGALNDCLRHELGHGDANGKFGDARLYSHLLARKDDNPADTQPPSRTVRAISKIAAVLNVDKFGVLHALDREERYANAFSRKHRAHLNPISLRSLTASQ